MNQFSNTALSIKHTSLKKRKCLKREEKWYFNNNNINYMEASYCSEEISIQILFLTSRIF